jgi:hypothetical protein
MQESQALAPVEPVVCDPEEPVPAKDPLAVDVVVAELAPAEAVPIEDPFDDSPDDIEELPRVEADWAPPDVAAVEEAEVPALELVGSHANTASEPRSVPIARTRAAEVIAQNRCQIHAVSNVRKRQAG